MIDISQERDRQRLIDGELSIDDENDAIIQCEINPDLWRGLALSMMEQHRMAIAWSNADRNVHPTGSLTASPDASVGKKQVHALRWISWSTAASVAALLGCSVISFIAGHREGAANSSVAPMSGPVIVQVQFPEEQSTVVANPASMNNSLFNSEERAILAEAGYRVDEKLQWQIVEEGDAYLAIPNREVRFVSMQP